MENRRRDVRRSNETRARSGVLQEGGLCLALIFGLFVSACSGEGPEGTDFEGADGGTGRGESDALLFTKPVTHERLIYDVASTQIAQLNVSPQLREIGGLSICSDVHFAVQPFVGNVTTEVGRCGVEVDGYYDQTSVIVRDGEGAVRNVFGVPGRAFGPAHISPDGRLLAMRGRTPSFREGGQGDGEPALFIMNVDGDLLATMRWSVADVRWFDNDRLMVVSPIENGAGFTLMSSTVEGAAGQDYHSDDVITLYPDGDGFVKTFDISSDSRWIAFVWRELVDRDAGIYRDEIYTIDMQAQEVRQIASTPDYAAGDNVSGLISTYGIRHVNWGLTNDSVYVYMGGTSAGLPSDRNGYLLNLSTTEEQTIPLTAARTGTDPPADILNNPGPRLLPLAATAGLEVLGHPQLPTVSGENNWPITEYYAIPRSRVPTL